MLFEPRRGPARSLIFSSDDLFHAMEAVQGRFSAGITGRTGRTGVNRYAGRYLPTICPKILPLAQYGRSKHLFWILCLVTSISSALRLTHHFHDFDFDCPSTIQSSSRTVVSAERLLIAACSISFSSGGPLSGLLDNFLISSSRKANPKKSPSGKAVTQSMTRLSSG
jgi:hypothetical protein